MATNTYGLPDETLQLIAASPDFDFRLAQQGTTAQFATPDVRRSDLISALRNIPGAANPGFTQYANPANGAALQPVTRSYRGANTPGLLTMPEYVAPAPTSYGGDEPRSSVIDSFIPNVPDFSVFPDVIEPDVIEPEVLEREVIEPEVIEPDLPEPEVTEPEVIEPEIIEPEIIDPDDFEPFVPLPVEETEEPEKTGTVEITPVDPAEEVAQDDGTTEGIIDVINDGLPTPEVEEETPVETVPVETFPVEQPVEEVSMDDGTTEGIQEVIDSLPVEPEPEVIEPEVIEPEIIEPEISEPDPEPQPETAPEPEPSLRDEIVNAIESQPQPEPEPVVPEPEPYVPEPEPYIPEPEPVGDPDFYEPYIPDMFEPDPYNPEPDFIEPSFPETGEISDEDAALIDAWLMDQFGGGGGGGISLDEFFNDGFLTHAYD